MAFGLGNLAPVQENHRQIAVARREFGVRINGPTIVGLGGGCIPAVTDILKKEMLKAGATVTNYLCPHFDFSRAELCQVRISNSFP